MAADIETQVQSKTKLTAGKRNSDFFFFEEDNEY